MTDEENAKYDRMCLAVLAADEMMRAKDAEIERLRALLADVVNPGWLDEKLARWADANCRCANAENEVIRQNNMRVSAESECATMRVKLARAESILRGNGGYWASQALEALRGS